MNPNDRIAMRIAGTTVPVLVLCGLALGFVALAAVDANALCLLPTLLLAAPLLMRRYPGERMLAGISDRRRSRWPLPHAAVPRLGRTLSIAPHGGQLIARSLAVRPPPLLSPAS